MSVKKKKLYLNILLLPFINKKQKNYPTSVIPITDVELFTMGNILQRVTAKPDVES